jgi:hypothetical protein
MTPIFTGSDDVGVGVVVGVVVTIGLTVGVVVSKGVDVDAGVGEGVFSSSPPPQAANIGTIKTKARTRAMNLYHKLLFGHMINHLLLQHR